MRIFVCLITIPFLLISCASVKPVEQAEKVGLLYIDGTVQGASGNEIALVLKLPEFKKPLIYQSVRLPSRLSRKVFSLKGLQRT
jgi:hypothetical protein